MCSPDSFSVKHHPPVLCVLPQTLLLHLLHKSRMKHFLWIVTVQYERLIDLLPITVFQSSLFQPKSLEFLFGLEWHKENLVMKSKSTFKLACCMMGSISDQISSSPPATAESHSLGTIISFLEKKVQPRYHRLSSAPCPRGSWGFTLYMRLGVTTDMTRNNWVPWIL